MASSDILSQTLSSITSIKLDELSNHRASFEAGKADLLNAVDNEDNPTKKLKILLDRIKNLSSMGKIDSNPLISLENLRKFLQQADKDPSVSIKLQQDWQSKLENELDIHSLKYEYASLYGRLVNEWLSVANASPEGAAFEEVGRKEMREQRATWEEYVFTAKEPNTTAIKDYLDRLFNSTADTKSVYLNIRSRVESFEHQMATQVHFNDISLKWTIEGLLRSDLVTDEKRKILQDFFNNKVVLAEVADVLNMRMDSLDRWKWDPAGTPIEQRRQLNGRYRFYHDEDLLQAILLRYIGIKWSVFFKESLTWFAKHAFKPSSLPVPESENVESDREDHFQEQIFLEQLTAKIDEKRVGYNNDTESEASLESSTRKSGQQITQHLLHFLVAELIMRTRLGQEPVVVRSDFKWFGPSLPHSTIFTVLGCLGVSQKWINFFDRALRAPLKFVHDGADATVRIRKRGTPISGPLSDVLGETVLFCLDFAFNQKTNGTRLYRLHDDIWFWGSEETCITGWKAMTEFAQMMGLEVNEQKTGSVKVNRQGGSPSRISSLLPKGDVRWGFLKLDSESGRFLIDQAMVDIHIEELRRQLGACKSVFDWIQAWNVYGARFFGNNFGRPAQSFSRAHVDMLLDTFARIQKRLFDGGSVATALKEMISQRFGVSDIPEGYLYFPASVGGLDLKNPFVDLYLVRDKIMENPDQSMYDFITAERKEYEGAKMKFEKELVHGKSGPAYSLLMEFKEQPFPSFEDFTKYREQTSFDPHTTFRYLTTEPDTENVIYTADVSSIISRSGHNASSPYHRWILQLYAPDMISRFGGLNIVEKTILPTGMVSMFRESRFKWQG